MEKNRIMESIWNQNIMNFCHPFMVPFPDLVSEPAICNDAFVEKKSVVISSYNQSDKIRC